MQKLLPLLAAVLANILFGSSLVGSKFALLASNNNVWLVSAVRMIITAIVFFIPVLIGKIKVNFTKRKIMQGMKIAVFYPVLAFGGEILALTHISAAQYGVYTSLVPIFMLGVAFLSIGEKPSFNQIFFSFVSLSGVVVMNINGVSGNLSLLAIFYMGLVILALCLNRVFIKTVDKDMTSYEITLIIMSTGAVVFTIVSIFSAITSGDVISYYQPILTLDFILPILYLGIITNGLAVLINVFATSNLPLNTHSAVSNLAPVAGVVFGVTLLGEPFSTIEIIGSIIIILGMVGNSLAYTNKPAKK